jgi:hypothetical protein
MPLSDSSMRVMMSASAIGNAPPRPAIAPRPHALAAISMGSSNSRIGRGKAGAKVGLAFYLV